MTSPEGINEILQHQTEMSPEELWKDPKFKFNELGPEAKNCSFFGFRDEKIEPSYKFFVHERTFAFVDTISSKEILNVHFLFWLELFCLIEKRTSKVFFIKDFVAKRSAKLLPLEQSVILYVNFEQFKIKERNVSQVKESEFNLRDHIDPQM